MSKDPIPDPTSIALSKLLARQNLSTALYQGARIYPATREISLNDSTTRDLWLKITPLHKAAAQGDLDMIKSLIAEKADINAKQYTGFTPLDEAIQHGHKEAAKLLLSTDGNVATFSCNHAIKNKDYDIIKLLLDNKKIDLNQGYLSLVQTAVEVSDLEILSLLFKHIVNINVVDDEGRTLMHSFLSAKMKITFNDPIIKLLIESKADLTIKDHKGTTALDILLPKISKSYLEQLWGKVSDTIKQAINLTPLVTAISKPIIEYLDLTPDKIYTNNDIIGYFTLEDIWDHQKPFLASLNSQASVEQVLSGKDGLQEE